MKRVKSYRFLPKIRLLSYINNLQPNMSSDNDIATCDPIKASPPSEEVDVSPPKYSWYHGVFFNATVVGISAFAAPGLWNAMNSVGAGGQQTPYLVM